MVNNEQRKLMLITKKNTIDDILSISFSINIDERNYLKGMAKAFEKAYYML